MDVQRFFRVGAVFNFSSQNIREIDHVKCARVFGCVSTLYQIAAREHVYTTIEDQHIALTQS